MTSVLPPADWYPDPTLPGQLRYWDGATWTAHVAVRTTAVAGAELRTTETWSDLADNRPGQHVRREAEGLRSAAPVKTFLGRLLGVHTDERAFRVGAKGEEVVARRLADLDGSWKVLHSIPVGENGADIDHLVVGPGGVYSLNTKGPRDY